MAGRERNKSQLLRSVINAVYRCIKSSQLKQSFYIILVTPHDSRTRTAIHYRLQIEYVDSFFEYVLENCHSKDCTWQERKRESEEEKPFSSITIPSRDRVVTED